MIFVNGGRLLRMVREGAKTKTEGGIIMAASRFAVDGDTYWKIRGKMLDIERQVRQKGGCPLNPRQLLGALQAIGEGRFAQDPASALVLPQRPPLIHGMFANLETQIANMRKWNERRRWGFTSADFVLGDPPAWPDDRLVAVVLVPYLPDHKGVTGIQRTFDELWEVTSRRQPNRDRWSEVRSDPQHLTLLDGITHTPGLRWEVIDLGANWDKQNGIAPNTVRSPASSPHAGILAATAHHPRWVRKMDSTTVPFVWAPGYRLAVPGRVPRVPIVGWSRDERLVHLRALWDDRRVPDYAVPRFRSPSLAGSGT
ncbi:MAG: hypothetical protein Q7S96_02340 [bacterium]|nr:hypothetical protein [bacterium]